MIIFSEIISNDYCRRVSGGFQFEHYFGVDSVHPKSAVENNLLFPADLVSTISSSGALCYDENGSYKYFHIRESYHSATKEKGENISWKFYKKIQSFEERRIPLMYKKNSKQGREKKRILRKKRE